jgi:hypothetical protein
MKMSVEFQDVGMSQIALDFDLALDLFLNSALLQLTFVQDLEGTDESVCSLACEVNAAKFAFSKRLANFEHSQVETS